VPIDLTTIIGPLIGAFVGVGLGLIANELWRRKLACDRKYFFRNFLPHEIKRSIELLEKENIINLIPVDAWDSLVNSGDLALFTHNLVIHLSDLYFDIEDYNYEVNWIWNHNFTFDEGGDVADQKKPQYLEVWTKKVLEKLKAIEKEFNEIDG
jgi:hypothetical protein